MSQRTIVEFNHDYAHLIAKDPEGFLDGIRTMLNEGSTFDVRAYLKGFGVRVTNTLHHSERRKLVTKDSVFEF